MGVVIEFRPRGARVSDRREGGFPVRGAEPTARRAAGIPASGEPGSAVLAAARDSGDLHAVLEAASELLAVCRDRFGFTVMEDGLPRDPEALADALVALLRGLTLLEAGLDGRRPYPGFGVYFGRHALHWFDDGGGRQCALGVPDDVEPAALARFIGERIGHRHR